MKSAASSGLALHAERAFVQRNEPASDGQSQSDARFARIRPLATDEWLEDALQPVSRDTVAGVLDLQVHLTDLDARTKDDLAR